ncbi:cupin domain-containing protein [Streptomyces luteireticuli]|uniref:cupin domain-containing protein n=1 Tax=Streptomyces luteireticuli TaxID=173858 RepID=UPI003558ABAD
MQRFSLDSQVNELLERASTASSGRSATTVYGGQEQVLRQVVLALAAGSCLAEHDNPGDATVLVLRGHVRLVSGEAFWEARAGELIVVPQARHRLEATEDSAVLLSIAKRT